MFKGVETPVVRGDSNKYRPWRFPDTQAYIIVTKIYHPGSMLDNFETRHLLRPETKLNIWKRQTCTNALICKHKCTIIIAK